MEVNDLALPKFPALQKCILIDARHRSRKEVSNRIQSSMLYHEVIEADSVSDALTRLEAEPFDSCFMGPTLSRTVVREVIKTGLELKNTDECAFLVLLSKDLSPESSEELLSEYRDLGAHGIITHPGPIKSFIDGTVKAVILANSDTPWASIAVSNGMVEEGFEGEKSWNIASLELAFASIAANLKDLAKQIKTDQSETKPGGGWLTEAGRPTELSTHRLSSIIHESLASHRMLGNSQALVKILEPLLSRWLVDCCIDSEVVALKNLKSALFRVGTGS